MREQAPRQAYWWLPFFSFARTGSPPVKHAAVEVDIAAAYRGLQRRTADRPMSRAAIEGD